MKPHFGSVRRLTEKYGVLGIKPVAPAKADLIELMPAVASFANEWRII
jgi:hypothetical protein